MALTLRIPIFVPTFVKTYIDDMYTDPYTYRERSLWNFFISDHSSDAYRRFKIGTVFCSIIASTIIYGSYFSRNKYFHSNNIRVDNMILISCCNLLYSLCGGLIFSMPYGIPCILYGISVLGISSTMGLLIFFLKKCRN